MKQQLNLTVGLFQSINILQMSNLELSEMLQTELMSNPFLEENKSTDEWETNSEEERYDNIDVLEERSDNFDPMSLIVEEQSLISHVMTQMPSLIDDQVSQFIAIYLINLLHESGYIELDIKKAQKDLQVSEKVILSILYKLQKMEPAGMFARSLEECLTLQLKERDEYDKIYKIILENLPLLASHEIKKLTKLCKIDEVMVRDYIKNIQTLTPKPGAGFMHEHISNMLPDVILTIEDELGEFKLRLNGASKSALTLNKSYYGLAKSRVSNLADKEMIANYYYNASNLIRSVTQRLSTIKEVASAIAEKQKEFFLKGVMHLKPMTLGEIALACGINESTVSRATSNKYIETPTGIYEMKFFFSSSLQSKNNGAGVSSTKVKEIIKSIIDSEDSLNVYSDDNIVEALTKFNINIARRTVAKYRDLLGIKTSGIRKRVARSKI